VTRAGGQPPGPDPPSFVAAVDAGGGQRPRPGPTLLNGGGPYVRYTAVWNLTGNPAASIPVGVAADGLPLGVQTVGRPGSEATLLALTAQLGAVRPWAQRRPPLSPAR
jgi:amidase